MNKSINLLEMWPQAVDKDQDTRHTRIKKRGEQQMKSTKELVHMEERLCSVKVKASGTVPGTSGVPYM